MVAMLALTGRDGSHGCLVLDATPRLSLRRLSRAAGGGRGGQGSSGGAMRGATGIAAYAPNPHPPTPNPQRVGVLL
eukprot:scaffold47227_cov34-Tisochrysis_lutea.AAC.1